jgi:hypothetical protein
VSSLIFFVVLFGLFYCYMIYSFSLINPYIQKQGILITCTPFVLLYFNCKHRFNQTNKMVRVYWTKTYKSCTKLIIK